MTVSRCSRAYRIVRLVSAISVCTLLGALLCLVLARRPVGGAAVYLGLWLVMAIMADLVVTRALVLHVVARADQREHAIRRWGFVAILFVAFPAWVLQYALATSLIGTAISASVGCVAGSVILRGRAAGATIDGFLDRLTTRGRVLCKRLDAAIDATPWAILVVPAVAGAIVVGWNVGVPAVLGAHIHTRFHTAPEVLSFNSPLLWGAIELGLASGLAAGRLLHAGPFVPPGQAVARWRTRAMWVAMIVPAIILICGPGLLRVV